GLEGPGERAAPALWGGLGVGGRPAALAEPRADPRPADRTAGAPDPLVSAPAGAGGHGRGPVPRERAGPAGGVLAIRGRGAREEYRRCRTQPGTPARRRFAAAARRRRMADLPGEPRCRN